MPFSILSKHDTNNSRFNAPSFTERSLQGDAFNYNFAKSYENIPSTQGTNLSAFIPKTDSTPAPPSLWSKLSAVDLSKSVQNLSYIHPPQITKSPFVTELSKKSNADSSVEAMSNSSTYASAPIEGSLKYPPGFISPKIKSPPESNQHNPIVVPPGGLSFPQAPGSQPGHLVSPPPLESYQHKTAVIPPVGLSFPRAPGSQPGHLVSPPTPRELPAEFYSARTINLEEEIGRKALPLNSNLVKTIAEQSSQNWSIPPLLPPTAARNTFNLAPNITRESSSKIEESKGSLEVHKIDPPYYQGETTVISISSSSSEEESEKLEISSESIDHLGYRNGNSNGINYPQAVVINCLVCKCEEDVVSLKCNHQICKNCLKKKVEEVLKEQVFIGSSSSRYRIIVKCPSCGKFIEEKIYSTCPGVKEMIKWHSDRCNRIIRNYIKCLGCIKEYRQERFLKQDRCRHLCKDCLLEKIELGIKQCEFCKRNYDKIDAQPDIIRGVF